MARTGQPAIGTDPAADRALARLRQGDSLRALAALAADHLIDTPSAALIDVDALTARLGDAVRAAARAPSPGPDHPLRRPTADVRDRTVDDLLPAGLGGALDPILAVPWVPSEAVALRLLRHDAMRMLVRETLSSTLTRFATRARSVDDGVLGGLGGKALQRGRGLLGSLGGSMGSAAEGLVGAVREEFEHALEQRIREFLTTATDEALKGIATWVADPAHAGPLATLRVSAWQALRATPLAELAGSATDDPTAWEAAARDVLRTLADRPTLDADLRSALTAARDAVGDTPVGAWAPDAPVRDALRDAAIDAVLPALHAIVASDAFAAWWADLHA